MMALGDRDRVKFALGSTDNRFRMGSGKKRIGGCADLRMLCLDKGWD